VDGSRHRADTRNGHGGRDGVDHFSDAMGNRFRFFPRSNLEDLGGCVVLRVWHIERFLERSGNLGDPGVFNYTDDLYRALALAGSHETLANRILVGPKVLGHCLVDDGNARCVFVVGFRKVAAAQQRDTHRFETVRGNYDIVGVWSDLPLRHWEALNVEVIA